MDVTVVGGGVAGLVAAITCAETGAAVRLLEARSSLGGRATTTPGDYHTNLGPHAFYTGPLWEWLTERDLVGPYRRPRPTGIRVRWQANVSRIPPRELVAAYRMRKATAPVDLSLREWMSEHCGGSTADAVAGLAGVITFDHDPGRLSAAFVWERLPRILFSVPPAARYVVGGWEPVINRLAAHARSLGVQVATGEKVDALDDLGRSGPIILALGPRAARALTGDETLAAESPQVALLDLGLETRRGDPYIVSDLDEGGFVDRFTAVDPSLAPAGHGLLQASIGQRPDETLDSAVERIEGILDVGFTGWRLRESWRRRGSVRESTGAIDLPGSTWRDRPQIEWSDGVLLCGDWVAAPGHLAEVSWASAVDAAERATEIRPVASRGY